MNKKLSGEYVAGFVDGEGCFSLSMRKDVRHERRGVPIYYSWKAIFAISLRTDDCELLEKIKNTLDCGAISFSKKGEQAHYQVSNLDEISKFIIPFFIKHPLMGKKGSDFGLWSEAIVILLKYKKLRGRVNVQRGQQGFFKVDWDSRDTNKLMDLQQRMGKYKSSGASRKWRGSKIGRG